MKSALITDFYELTMMQGYFIKKHNPRVVFDVFYRNNPFNGGYTIFTGLEEVIDALEGFRFSDNDIEYLRNLNLFREDFLDYLSTYHFSGDLYAFEEGTPAFPGEPLVRIETNLMDAQLIESFILNQLNFQTLIATKACRMTYATKGKGSIMEFGLRRAQGEDGAHIASRASFIGGTKVTSNTYAGRKYNIPVAGTMAHSWIMSFDSEEEAFREFAEIYPDNAIFLIDTYDTLGSGIDAAIKVGLELKAKGKNMGVRIDSGDLSYLPRVIRDRLDQAGLDEATICVSNDLTEEIIQTLVSDGVPIDSWGIGTHLVTGGSQASLNGVYKLAAKEKDGVFEPTMKMSNSFEKTTNPGIKQVYRFHDASGNAVADLIALNDEKIECGKAYTYYHPFSMADYFVMKPQNYHTIRPLLNLKMKDGKRVSQKRDIREIKNFVQVSLLQFHKSYKRQINPHIYKVSLSENLKELKLNLIKELKAEQNN